MDAIEIIRNHLHASAETKRHAAESCASDVVAASQLIIESLRSDGKLMLCGNGGSAADSQHIAAEFVSSLDHRAASRRALPAIALTTDTSFLTASANDYGFENVFARQVEALGRPGDVLLGITTSGTSRNVIAAMEVARQLELVRIGLTGRGGGTLTTLCDVTICVPSDSIQHVQETHIAIGHLLCQLVEVEFFN